jgi:hypothetical protein
MSTDNNQPVLKEVGTAIGVGLIAGLAGTLVMTVCQKIDMKMSGRKASQTPSNAVREALDVKPVSEGKTQEVSNKIHWVYGTSLGMVRGLISLFGLKGLAAHSAFFATVWGAELCMLPALRVAPPVTKESPETIAKDGMFHLVYALSAGLVFETIMGDYCSGSNESV